MIQLTDSDKGTINQFLEVAINSAELVIANGRGVKASAVRLPVIRYLASSIQVDLRAELDKISGNAVEKLARRH